MEKKEVPEPVLDRILITTISYMLSIATICTVFFLFFLANAVAYKLFGNKPPNQPVQQCDSCRYCTPENYPVNTFNFTDNEVVLPASPEN